MPGQMKQLLLGRPKRTEQLRRERMSKRIALSAPASNGISSSTYATEQIIVALSVAGAGALQLVTPVGLVIAALMLLVGVSYAQAIRAYPSGGGSYAVAREALGPRFGLIAGASLLTDNILNVSVSIAAGTAAVTSAVPELLPYTVPIAIALTVLLALANLRGMRESGVLLAWPTYLFIGLLGFTIVSGLVRLAMGGSIPIPERPAVPVVEGLSLLLILRAFALGSVVMSGMESIANGVPSFEAPEARNARITLAWMIAILTSFFLGLNTLAVLTGATPTVDETLVSQLARGILGTGPLYYTLQAATAMLLLLAANTSYSDFPQLGSFIAADGSMPRHFKDRGSRLVYSNGIVLLTVAAITLIVAFRGQTSALLPLYAMGIFAALPLLQGGMAIRDLKSHERGRLLRIALNLAGALATSTVLVIIVVARFMSGAWVVVVLIPSLVAYFSWVTHQYRRIDEKARLQETDRHAMSHRAVDKMHNHVVLLVARIDRRLLRALDYATALDADTVEAIFVDVTGDRGASMRRRWDELETGIRVTIVQSPEHEVISPILEHIRAIPRPTADHVVTVILPETVAESIPDSLLHGSTSFWLKATLFDEPGVILTDVPFHLTEEEV